MPVTRFPNGVSTNTQAQTLSNFGMPDPTEWHLYFDDFNKYTAADWTITTVEAGSVSATEALANADGGVLTVTNDNDDDDSDFLQSDSEMFVVESGKRMMFKARFKVSDATQSDFVMGLQVTDTTPLLASAGIYFIKDDGDANLDVHSTVASTITSQTAIATVSDDTYLTVGYDYDGASTVGCYVNDVRATALDLGTLSSEALAISFGLANGASAANLAGSTGTSMNIDYIFAAKER